MKRFAEILSCCLVPLFGIAFSANAVADGRIEINQLCVPTGCFAGDSPGFPVEISEPGSYLLTSDLVVLEENAIGILLTGSGFTLDLGGHSISGTVECTGTGPTCSQVGPLFGIATAFLTPPLADTTIRNGTVSGFFADCVAVTRGGGAFGILIQDLHVSHCAGDGIDVGGASIIDSVSVRNSAGDGIFAGPNTVVRNSVLINNGGQGVDGAACSGNIFSDNGDLASVDEESCSNQIDSNICDSVLCPP